MIGSGVEAACSVCCSGTNPDNIIHIAIRQLSLNVMQPVLNQSLLFCYGPTTGMLWIIDVFLGFQVQCRPLFYQ
jgi:hypothetical protein